MSELQIKNLQGLKTFSLLNTKETSLIIGGNSSLEAREAFLQNHFDDVISGGSGKDRVYTQDGRLDLVVDSDGNDLINSDTKDNIVRR